MTDMDRRALLTGLLAAPAVLRAQARPRVVASFSILADLVAQVGGDAIDLVTIVGPGQDAHTFAPSPSHAATLREAQAAVTIGLGFEGWWDRLRQASGFRGRAILASRNVTTRAAAAHGHGHGHGERDPHIWQDPRRVQTMLTNIADGLAALVPAQQAAFRANAAAAGRQFQEAEAESVRLLDPIPRAQRRVLTTHEAFAYFGERFGVDFIAAQGVSTAAEPTPQLVAGLIRQVRERRVRAIFLETVGADRVVQRIAAEAGVAVGGRLYSDALTPPGGEADTTAAMLRHNGRTLAAALG
jgi:zinc/manganese transport system substrate-binding protein